MAEKLTAPQIQLFAVFLSNIINTVVKPLQLECSALAAVLNHMGQQDPLVANAINIALTNERANPDREQELNLTCRAALDRALQHILEQHPDPDALEDIRKVLGWVN